MQKRRNIYLIYTFLFLGIGLVVWASFWTNGWSFVQRGDGIKQHYVALAYYGEYLRKIVSEWFGSHSFVIPKWDMNIGYGEDILVTLHFYAIGDPLCLLSAFVSPQHCDVLLTVLALLRLYLAGMMFLLFLRHKKIHGWPAIVGALVYCFSGYVAYFLVKHPFFINPMIYAPLIAIGTDKIIEGEKPWLYILSLVIAAISNFYFFYMLAVLTAVYGMITVWGRYGKEQWKNQLTVVMKLFLYALLAIGMAAVVLVPVVAGMLSTSRAYQENSVPILYQIRYYVRLFSGFLTMESPGWQNFLGYPGITLISLFLLFLEKEKKGMKAGVILLTLMSLFPAAGMAMNGFSYVTNRWMFGYSFLVAWITASEYENLWKLSRRQYQWIGIGVLFECFLCAVGCAAKYIAHQEMRLPEIGISCLLLLTEFVLLNKNVRDKLKRYRNVCVLAAVLIGFGVNFNMAYQNNGFTEGFIENGSAWQIYQEDYSAALKEKEDDNQWRYDITSGNRYYNSAMMHQISGTGYFFSIENGLINKYRQLLYLGGAEYKHTGFDDRSVLDTLQGVRYYVTKEEDAGLTPYLYQGEDPDTVQAGKREYLIYTAQNALPLVYAYDTCISESDFEKLDVVRRQEIMLDAVVINDELASTCQNAAIEEEQFTDVNCSFEVECQKGVVLKEQELQIKKKKKGIDISYKGAKNSEIYLIFRNLTYRKDFSNILEKMSAPTDDDFPVNVTRGDNRKRFSIPNPYTIGAYTGRKDFLCNVGYTETTDGVIHVEFEKPGIYHFDEIQVVSQPVSDWKEKVAERKKEEASDLTIRDNSISFTTNSESEKIWCIAIPFSKGWKATIDGNKTILTEANIMNIGITVPKGKHEIVLTYDTPYGKTGLIITIVSLLILSLTLLWPLRKSLRRS